MCSVCLLSLEIVVDRAEQGNLLSFKARLLNRNVFPVLLFGSLTHKLMIRTSKEKDQRKLTSQKLPDQVSAGSI